MIRNTCSCCRGNDYGRAKGRRLTYGGSVGALAGLVEVAIVLVVAYLIYITVAGSTRRRSRYFPPAGGGSHTTTPMMVTPW